MEVVDREVSTAILLVFMSDARQDKEHDRDVRLARTQTSAVSEHANETGHLPHPSIFPLFFLKTKFPNWKFQICQF